jgi:hypothetical protein
LMRIKCFLFNFAGEYIRKLSSHTFWRRYTVQNVWGKSWFGDQIDLDEIKIEAL